VRINYNCIFLFLFPSILLFTTNQGWQKPWVLYKTHGFLGFWEKPWVFGKNPWVFPMGKTQWEKPTNPATNYKYKFRILAWGILVKCGVEPWHIMCVLGVNEY
jgi:hypothetical protein